MASTAFGMATPYVNGAAKEIADGVGAALNTTFSAAELVSEWIPGSRIIFRYVRASHQNDPFRTLLEILLVVFMFWYFGRKQQKPGFNDLELTPKEVQELIDEWEPEPLVPPLTDFQKTELEKLPIIAGPAGPKPKLADGKERINLSSYNFLGIMNQESIKEKAVEALRKYGVGSCGPPGFYGTIDVHMDLERGLAKFVGTESAIIYSQGFSTVASVIPAFSKRGDLLIVDDGVSFATQKGVQISRSVVKYFKHNDMADLERVLEQVRLDDAKSKKKLLNRRFIVVEGLYLNHGDICPLPELIALKEKYKYRIMMEESFSFGVLGKRGAGISDHYDVPANKIDILIGSMTGALASSGGFCCGTKEVVEHQRLSGQAYTFSASLPAMLAVAAIEGLNILEKEPAILTRLRENASVIHSTLNKNLHPDAEVYPREEASPIAHLRLRLQCSREEQERLLQDVVDEAARNGVLVSRAKYVTDQELHPPQASIRLVASAGHTRKETEKAATVVRDAARKVLKSRK
ncbi:serine palmitoyltransferase component [Rhizophlyctis rosea]|uniref:serine C-palmitoyltransferase n=1 Tax=Rhizophlyctis rosea TaxID=64517 RepID=A0AAD5X7Q8_9FUNG|nr:serine palmitoyltransferase component [Rhizophlyctis rosea]